MKKAIALLLVALMGLSLFGCKSKEQKEAEKAAKELLDALNDAAKD